MDPRKTTDVIVEILSERQKLDGDLFRNTKIRRKMTAAITALLRLEDELFS